MSDEKKKLQNELPSPPPIEEETPQQGEPNPNLMEEIPVERRIKAFVQGEINLADLYGMTHEELYEIAEYGPMLFDEGKIDEAEIIFNGLTGLDPYDENFHFRPWSAYSKNQGRQQEKVIRRKF